MSKMSNEKIKAISARVMIDMGVSMEHVLNYQQNDVIPQFAYGLPVKSKSWTDDELSKYGVRNRPFAITTDEVCGYKMISFLYVSPYKEDLDYAYQYRGYSKSFHKLYSVYAYCYNVDRPYLSEPGMILVEIVDGNIRRVG